MLRCPSCRFYNLAPGDLEWDDETGLPVPVKVSAHILLWPDRCACCLNLNDTSAAASHTRVDWGGVLSAMRMAKQNIGFGLMKFADSTEQQHWPVPYCWECLAHVEGRSRYHNPNCCTRGAAVSYDGWNRSFHGFSFFNWQFANRFILLNLDKCIG